MNMLLVWARMLWISDASEPERYSVAMATCGVSLLALGQRASFAMQSP